MIDVNQLREISESLKLHAITEKLAYIQNRIQQDNTELIIPIVGEYGAGKSSFLNALINAKLETSTIPTTATILEVRFSSAKEKAIVLNTDGSSYEISDVNSLKNKELTDSELVCLYDTSTRIPKTVVLVDTPGFSSLNRHHQKVLTTYLPLADVLLLAVDINQGVTASALKFINMLLLAKKRIYVVITKCDTKPESEQNIVKQYIKENIKIPIEKIICISAQQGKTDELLSLIKEIQKEKKQIVAEITIQHLNYIRKELLDYINELVNSSKLSTKDMDQKIMNAKRSVQKAQSQINHLIADLERNVERIAADTVFKFSDRVFDELEEIAKSPPSGYNINQLIIAKIENITGLFFDNYKSDVFKELGRLAREHGDCVDGIPLQSLKTLDLQSVTLEGFSYNIDVELPEVRNLNKRIAGGIKLAVATAASAIDGGAMAASAGIEFVLSNTGDTVSDVASIIPEPRITNTIFRAKREIQAGMDTINQYDEQISRYIPAIQQKSQGALEGLVGLITERIYAKPQRKRLIDDFIISSLQPEFKMCMEQITISIISSIREMLFTESQDKIMQLRNGLESLKAEKEIKKFAYAGEINSLLAYKKILED